MNQTIRIIIIGLLIVALAIWSVVVFRSCQETAKPVEDTSTSVDTTSLDDLFLDDDTTDVFEEDEYIDEDEDDATTDYSANNTASTSDEGQFLVIAGAFEVEANARKLVNRLNQKGYKAGIRVFLGSRYHAAVVGAYHDMDDAFDVAIKLADEGYKDVYVHKKRKPKKK